MAYRALASSATTAWLRQDGTPVSPRSAVVVSDFESQVTGIMDYIKPDYTIERGMRTVVINQCDGCGMALPTLITGNLMVRLPWVKGLVTPFDFIAWCNEHNCPAVVTDYWGKTHDLAAENIEIIFTESQFKMAKYYESWEDYCNKFEQYGCCARATNFEEEWIEDSKMNYQFLQTLTEMTDDEVSAFTAKARNRIQSVTSTQDGMLDILGCNKRVLLPYQQALKMYPPLLRLNQFRSNIAAMKKRMVLDARSGAIKCRNKRLFVVPDIYAWCERLFLGIENPVGLLKNGEVAANIFKGKRIACLRSPHLFIEWALRDCVDNPEVYKWFTSNAVYISIHDMITRIVMCDCDGDELNCIDEPNLIAAAERTLKKWDVIPLFYDAIKAKAEFVDRDAMFRGLKRAYDFGNIGTISNSLTRLWNKPDPDVYAAKCVCKLNNFVIDAAKTGIVDSYENYPAGVRVKQAIGSHTSPMPHFFANTKNGRARPEVKRYAPTNNSTMNRICAMFEGKFNTNMNFRDIPKFNWEMLSSGKPFTYIADAVVLYERLSKESQRRMTEDFAAEKKQLLLADDALTQFKQLGSLENCYETILQYLFAGKYDVRIVNTSLFFQLFGDWYLANLYNNLQLATVCPHCSLSVVDMAKHKCEAIGVCIDCGQPFIKTNARQVRCKECQRKARLASKHEKEIKTGKRGKRIGRTNQLQEVDV